MRQIKDPKTVLRAFVRYHLTQRDAAAALGISPAYLSDLLRGQRTFSARVLARLGLRRAFVAEKGA
jgi:transcriptional regulator with XRE-family HTH domain